MTDQMLYDPENVKLPAEISKHNGYFDSDEAKARYEERKKLVQANYAVDKVLGKRRHDGSPNLKKLKPRHLKMISYFIEGVPSTEIAMILDVSHQCVLRVLKDPLAAQFIEDFADGHKADFNAMFPLVNGAIQDALTNPSISTKLKGVDRWNRLHKTVNGEGDDDSATGKTKEISAARFRFIDQIREIAEKTGAIEAEVVVITESG